MSDRVGRSAARRVGSGRFSALTRLIGTGAVAAVLTSSLGCGGDTDTSSTSAPCHRR